MKLRNLTLAFTAAVLLPTFAYAGNDTDAIRASFVRDLNHGGSTREFVLIAIRANAKPLGASNTVGELEQILLSFNRSLSLELEPQKNHAESNSDAGKAG